MLIETAFWASLRSSEERATRARLTVVAPEHFIGAVLFQDPVIYEESAIVKLAPAIPTEFFIGGSLSNGILQIWGYAPIDAVSALDVVTIEITEPGTVRSILGCFVH